MGLSFNMKIDADVKLPKMVSDADTDSNISTDKPHNTTQYVGNDASNEVETMDFEIEWGGE